MYYTKLNKKVKKKKIIFLTYFLNYAKKTA